MHWPSFPAILLTQSTSFSGGITSGLERRLMFTWETCDLQSADTAIGVTPVDETNAPLPVPPTTTVRHLFESYLDCFARPGRLFFRQVFGVLKSGIANAPVQLAQFATGAEKERLERLASNDGKGELADYLKDYPSYVNVLQDFPSAHPTLDYLCEVFRRTL